MASALLALANPLYQGFKAEKHFIDTAGVDKIGKAGSLKRLSTIPLGWWSSSRGENSRRSTEGTGRRGNSRS